MNELGTLSLESLRRLVDEAAALRAVVELQPAGGRGDKVFPPTYTKEGRATTKYALEDRRVDGRAVKTALLDSVASQANRMEEALLEGQRRGALHFPTLEVDFRGHEDLADLDAISVLQAPHRIADAIFRDSLLGGTLFRHSALGQSFVNARPANATSLFTVCPTALLFGVWDSTGPKGGMGAKFQRAVVSEVVAFDVETGVKTSSRIDPLAIERDVEIFKADDAREEWALTGKDKFSRGGKDTAGKPSAINHGNIAPSIDDTAGGITMDHARQTWVLSLGALRRLRFPLDAESRPFLSRVAQDAAEGAARTALAALGLAALAWQRKQGYDLRSRAALVPTGPLVVEAVGADGGVPERFATDPVSAGRLLNEAGQAAAAAGLGWRGGVVTLQPAPKLVELVRRSRALGAKKGAEAG